MPPLAVLPAAAESVFVRWTGGEVQDESLGWRPSPHRYRIAFRPVAGQQRYWYYRWRFPEALPVAGADALVVEARLRVAVEGPANPLTEFRLCASYDAYADAARQQRRQHDSVTLFHTLFIQEGWQSITSAPVRPARDLDGNYLMTGLFVGVVNPNAGRRVDVEIASLLLRPATPAERAAADAPPALLRGRSPRALPAHEATFRYGAWGNLWSGAQEWHPYLAAVPREALELCNLENALEAGLDTLMTPRIHHPLMGPPSADVHALDDVIRLIRRGHEQGVASIAMTYLTPYYAPNVPLPDCARAIRETVAALKAEPGLIAYYAIDEPKPDTPTLATWLWAQDAFAAADPTRPLLGCLNTRACIRAYARTDRTPLLDLYPLPGALTATSGGNPLELAQGVTLALEQGAQAPWIVPQAFATSFHAAGGGWRTPSPAELRLMAWSALAHGARGILWFALHGEGLCHGLEDQEGVVGIFGAGFSPLPGFGDEAVALGARIPFLGPLLSGTRRNLEAEKLLDPAAPAEAVRATWQAGADWDVMVLYNTDVKAAQTWTLRIPPELRRGRGIYRPISGERIERPDGTLTVTLAPGDGDLLLVADAAGAAEAISGVRHRQAGLLARRLRFRAIEARANGIAVPEPADATPEALTKAARELEAACAANPRFASAHAALRRIQPALTLAGWRMNLRVAATYPRFSATDITSLRAWNRQLIRCQGVYVLLRNALYAGRAAEVRPFAEAGAVLAEALHARADDGTFARVDGEALERLYRACQTLQ